MDLNDKARLAMRRLRNSARLTQTDVAKMVGRSVATVSDIENGKAKITLELLGDFLAGIIPHVTDLPGPDLGEWDALQLLLQIDGGAQLRRQEDVPASNDIPLDGEVEADGTVAAEHLAEILHPGAFRAAREAFSYPDRFPIPGAKPGMWITKATINMPRANLLEGDQLVCDPDLEPRLGDVVIATTATDQYHEEFDAEIEPPVTKLKLYREVDGEVWLWPLVDDDRPDQWEPWWRVVAVVVGVWRPLR